MSKILSKIALFIMVFAMGSSSSAIAQCHIFKKTDKNAIVRYTRDTYTYLRTDTSYHGIAVRFIKTQPKLKSSTLHLQIVYTSTSADSVKQIYLVVADTMRVNLPIASISAKPIDGKTMNSWLIVSKPGTKIFNILSNYPLKSINIKEAHHAEIVLPAEEASFLVHHISCLNKL
jgi:hypothetical protein